ncbi:MAG: hypothetical protein ACFFDK_13140 [Promethearchaeota archaeon]
MKNWDIGQEAKELDERPFSERMRIKKTSIKKVMGFLIIYFIIMGIFYIVL